MSKITKDEAKKELARRELARRESNGSDLGNPLKGASGISEAPGLLERVSNRALRNIPEAAQFVGGMAGSLGGARVGKPVLGGAAGGTVARTGGELLQKLIRGQLTDLTETEKKTVGNELMKTAGTTAITELAAGGLGKIGMGAGKGALEALIGKRVTERGLKEGFKRFLDPKFYQDRVPKEVVKKTSSFFNKLNSVTGKAVEKAVKGKANVFQPTKSIKQESVDALTRRSAESIDDLGSAVVSKAQLNKVKAAKKIIDDLSPSEKLPSIWNARKKIDKIRFRNKFDIDLENYLDDLRNSLNEPLKSSGDDVAKSFNRYSSVKEMEKDLGNKFRATLIDDETFSPNTEQFANTLLGTNKDEVVRGLKKLDSFLINADDRIVEDLLDVSATESLEKTIQFMGVAQRSLIGALGGQKGIAGGAALAQSPGGKALRSLVGRSIPTATTSVLTEEEYR